MSNILHWRARHLTATEEKRAASYIAHSPAGVTYSYVDQINPYLSGYRNGEKVFDPVRCDTAAEARLRAEAHAQSYKGQ